LTDTKAEAEMALRQAIVQHAQAFEADYPESLLSEFAVIACWTPMNESDSCEYSVHYHTETVAEHVAVGLFTMGVDIAMADDEEEE